MKFVIFIFLSGFPFYCFAQSGTTAVKVELQYASLMTLENEKADARLVSEDKMQVFRNGAFFSIGDNELICDSAILKNNGSFQAYEVTLSSRKSIEILNKIKGDVFYFDNKKNVGVLTGNIMDRDKKIIAQKLELDFSSGPFTIVKR